MESRMRAAMARGGGLVTAPSLQAAGVGSRQINAWVRDGTLVPVRRGVYTTVDLWETWDEFRDRPRARVRAAEQVLRIPHVFSHDSAALLHDLPLLRPQDAAVHVTRRHLRASVTRSGVRHHGARYDEARAGVVDGLPVLDVPRTVVDLARNHGYQAGLVSADAALHRGVPRSELSRAASELAGWPYSLTVDAVVADADPGAESPLETLARELVLEAGLGPVETQFPVPVSTGVAWVDLRVGRHLIEADGRAKSRHVADGGLSTRDLEQLLWEERRRQREVCEPGLGMSRLVWADMWGDARERAKDRLVAEEAVTRRRFGTELPPELAEFAARMRGRRRRAG